MANLLRLLLLILVLTSCNRQQKRVIGVVPQGQSHLFWQSVHAGAVAAARDNGVEIQWNGPPDERDFNSQIKIVESMINRRLDAIVIMVGGNDVFHWLERGAPSPYPATPVPVRRFFACHPEGPFTWRLAQWALVELARRLRRRWLRPIEVWERAGAWIAEARAMRARAVELRTAVPDPSVMLNRFELHFRRLLQRARAHARRVLVARQPWFVEDCVEVFQPGAMASTPHALPTLPDQQRHFSGTAAAIIVRGVSAVASRQP